MSSTHLATESHQGASPTRGTFSFLAPKPFCRKVLQPPPLSPNLSSNERLVGSTATPSFHRKPLCRKPPKLLCRKLSLAPPRFHKALCPRPPFFFPPSSFACSSRLFHPITHNISMICTPLKNLPLCPIQIQERP